MKMIKTLLFATLTALALSVPYAIADDAHHPDQQKGPSAQATPATSADADKSVQTMKKNTQKMQAQLDKISHAKNPQERQRLLQEHMQTMRENMMLGKSMMGNMMDCPMMEGGMGMMGGGMMGGGMGMMGGGTGPEAMMNRMNMMEKRMDMMQMMMEQMTKPQAPPMQAK